MLQSGSGLVSVFRWDGPGEPASRVLDQSYRSVAPSGTCSCSSDAPSSDALAPSSFLLLVLVRPGAPSSVLAPSSDALAPSSFLLLGAL